MTSGQARFWYGQAKGGGHWMDFDQIGTRLGLSLELVAGGFFLAGLLAPVLAFLACRYQAYVYAAIDRLRGEM